MASQSKVPAKKGGWGSMLSSAVAGLESRLDTILADGPEAGEKSTGEELPKTVTEGIKPAGSLAVAINTAGVASRDASRTRGSDRLAERLARATAQKSRLQVEGILRAPSSERTTSERNSIDAASAGGEVRKTEETELANGDDANVNEPPVAIVETPAEETADGSENNATTAGALSASALPINPARRSFESPRASVEITATSDDFDSSRPSLELSNGQSRNGLELEAEMERMRSDYETAEKQRQEEMHTYLEKIDALQAKLQYLAKETVAAAKHANASVGDPQDVKLAQKDEQIALLMEEGQQLSKTELRHLQTIKKLRAQGVDNEKAVLDMRKKLDKAERSEMEHKHKVRRAETAERQALEKAKQVPALQDQLDAMRTERDAQAEAVVSLNLQLQEAEKRASQAIQAAQNKALEADKNRIADLENELEDAQIEKKLAEDRAQAEVRKIREDSDRQRERWSVTELELNNEIKSVEAHLEAMRARVEEASTEGEGAESSAKLLRQIELLQNQYNVAKTNWETIEGSLNARLVTMEKDRDEAGKREAEIRKKARDAASKARKSAEEIETTAQKIRERDGEIALHQSTIESLQRGVQDAQAALTETKADFDRRRRIWESELAARLEEEKAKWQGTPKKPARGESVVLSRKASGLEIAPRRNQRPTEPFPGFERTSTRRSSIVPGRIAATPDRELTSPFSAHGSLMNFGDINGMPPTPTIEADMEDDFEAPSSPRQTINDLVSTTVTGAGPTVQLVDRLSAAVRKLEAEKATHKDELARLGNQRDEARDQIVALMREVEVVRNDKSRVIELEKEMQGVQKRYDACLEILGEREEEVEELKADVVELKQIYRELVEEKVGGR